MVVIWTDQRTNFAMTLDNVIANVTFKGKNVTLALMPILDSLLVKLVLVTNMEPLIPSVEMMELALVMLDLLEPSVILVLMVSLDSLIVWVGIA